MTVTVGTKVKRWIKSASCAYNYMRHPKVTQSDGTITRYPEIFIDEKHQTWYRTE